MRPSHMRLFTKVITLAGVKEAMNLVDAQIHRLSEDCVQPDPFHGQSEEHDRVVAAFTELYYLDQRVREEASAVFAKHGLADHGFGASVFTSYVPEWDKHCGDA